MGLETLDIRRWTGIPHRWETNEESPRSASVYLPKRVSRARSRYGVSIRERNRCWLFQATEFWGSFYTATVTGAGQWGISRPAVALSPRRAKPQPQPCAPCGGGSFEQQGSPSGPAWWLTASETHGKMEWLAGLTGIWVASTDVPSMLWMQGGARLHTSLPSATQRKLPRSKWRSEGFISPASWIQPSRGPRFIGQRISNWGALFQTEEWLLPLLLLTQPGISSGRQAAHHIWSAWSVPNMSLRSLIDSSPDKLMCTWWHEECLKKSNLI